MVLDIIALIIAALSLVLILLIVFKKFPVLSMIDTKSVPEEKEMKVKNGLIEKRLKRKAADTFVKIKDNVKPYYRRSEEKVKLWYHKILELEKHYREKSRKRPLTLEDKDEQEQKINTLLYEAEILKKKEFYKEAESKCIKVLSLDQKNIPAYHQLGDIYLELKDYDHAKEIFNFLIKLNAQDDKALSGLGHIASSLGNLKEARDDFLASINLNRKIASYQLDLARVYQVLGETDEALNCCQEALRLEPNNPKNLSSLLQICLETKNKGLAIRTFDKLEKVNPENRKLDELKKQVDAL